MIRTGKWDYYLFCPSCDKEIHNNTLPRCCPNCGFVDPGGRGWFIPIRKVFKKPWWHFWDRGEWEYK